MQVLELARCEWIERRENVIALGPSGTGKTHVALGLGLAACQRGVAVGFTTAAGFVHELSARADALTQSRLSRSASQMAKSCAALWPAFPPPLTGAEGDGCAGPGRRDCRCGL